jgi:hypothetical protein
MRPYDFGKQVGSRLQKQAAEPTWGQFGSQLANTLNPFGKAGPKGTNYMDTADKWYNPWTQNKDPLSKGEGTLMRAGQAAMGVGAAAAGAAGGLAAAAPTLASTPLTSLPAYFAGSTAAQGGVAAAGAGGVAASTRGQQMMQGAQNLATNATQMAGRVGNAYQTHVKPTLDRLNYEPGTAAKDLYSAATGHFDHVEGPGIVKMPASGIPGAPSLPSPMQMARSGYEFLAGK